MVGCGTSTGEKTDSQGGGGFFAMGNEMCEMKRGLGGLYIGFLSDLLFSL